MKPEYSHCPLSVTAERTRVLLGCYRRGDAEDPEIYIRAVAAVLAHYPEEVVRKITDPVRGLPSSSKWLPTVAEVRAACDEEMGPIYRQLERDRRAGESWKQLAAPEPPTAEQRARAVAHWETVGRHQMGQPEQAQPKETPEQALDRLRATAGEPVVIGRELGRFLATMKGPAA